MFCDLCALQDVQGEVWQGLGPGLPVPGLGPEASSHEPSMHAHKGCFVPEHALLPGSSALGMLQHLG